MILRPLETTVNLSVCVHAHDMPFYDEFGHVGVSSFKKDSSIRLGSFLGLFSWCIVSITDSVFSKLLAAVWLPEHVRTFFQFYV